MQAEIEKNDQRKNDCWRIEETSRDRKKRIIVGSSKNNDRTRIADERRMVEKKCIIEDCRNMKSTYDLSILQTKKEYD